MCACRKMTSARGTASMPAAAALADAAIPGAAAPAKKSAARRPSGIALISRLRDLETLQGVSQRAAQWLELLGKMAPVVHCRAIQRLAHLLCARRSDGARALVEIQAGACDG